MEPERQRWSWREGGAQRSQIDGGTRWSPEVEVGGWLTKAETRRPADLVDWWALVEMRELEATLEPLGRRTEVESGSQRLIAELWDPPDLSPMELELGRPAAIPCHRWWAERLTGSNGEGIEEGNRSMRGGGRGMVGWIFDQVNRSGEDWRTGISEWKSIKSPRSSLCSPPFPGQSPLPPRSLNPYPPSLVFSALTPGQTLWAHRLSALSLLMAMAHRPRQALALCLRWARAAPCHGVVIDWALGPKWGWCDLWFAGHQHPLEEGGNALLRTVPGQLCYWGGVKQHNRKNSGGLSGYCVRLPRNTKSLAWSSREWSLCSSRRTRTTGLFIIKN